MVSAVISRIVIMVFGTLYPAYSSYKAVKTKNVKEYVKWMMYWIVFAFFTCVETFADIFISWVPFYYELKILFVLWLLSPATKGASILYRKFVHPQLSKREKEIDTYIAKASDQGYSALLNLGSKGINYATNIVLTTAIKGQTKIADHLRKSYSLNDLSQGGNRKFRRDETDDASDLDDEADNRLIEENYRREMEEQDLDELSESSERPRSARRRPKSFASDAELHPVMEEEDENEGRPGKSQKYTHKDENKDENVETVEKVEGSKSLPTTPTTPMTPGGGRPEFPSSYRLWARSSSLGSPTNLSSWRSRASYSSYRK